MSFICPSCKKVIIPKNKLLQIYLEKKSFDVKCNICQKQFSLKLNINFDIYISNIDKDAEWSYITETTPKEIITETTPKEKKSKKSKKSRKK